MFKWLCKYCCSVLCVWDVVLKISTTYAVVILSLTVLCFSDLSLGLTGATGGLEFQDSMSVCLGGDAVSYSLEEKAAVQNLLSHYS